MNYKLNDFHRNVSDEELINDLLRTLQLLQTPSLTTGQYNDLGKFHSTYRKRFGSWNKALEKAGLTSSWNTNITKTDLFENIEKIWIELGRQPTSRDLKPPISRFAVKPYITKFGGWRNALEAFIEFINLEVDQNIEQEVSNSIQEQIQTLQETHPVIKHKTKRNPTDRLKVQVLMRDGNKCRLCGITLEGDNIHFDHIYPWSKGGETTLENIQILCAKHNLSKGDLVYENTPK